MAVSAGLVRRWGDAERAQNSIRHIGRGGHIGQWDEGDAIGEVRDGLVRHLQRQAALADPRRAHDRDQRAVSSNASRSATSAARPINGSSGAGGRCAGSAGARIVSLVTSSRVWRVWVMVTC